MSMTLFISNRAILHEMQAAQRNMEDAAMINRSVKMTHPSTNERIMHSAIHLCKQRRMLLQATYTDCRGGLLHGGQAVTNQPLV